MQVLSIATSTEEADRQAKIAVLPVGSFEQHGHHLPLATDSIVACAIAEAAAARYDLFLLPPITISCSHEHAGIAGTVSISASTLHQVIRDIAASLERQGIRQLVLVNGHGATTRSATSRKKPTRLSRGWPCSLTATTGSTPGRPPAW